MTRPENIIKYCPKCGSEEFIYDGSKSFKCSNCDFHFFVNSACAVAALIVNDKDEVLLTRRGLEPNAGMLDLPGGFVDPMESAEEAIKREVKEELNLDVTSTHYMTSFPNEYVFSGYSVFTTDIGFVCRVKNFDNMHVKDDISGYGFYSSSSLNYDDISFESVRKIIKEYFKENMSVKF